MGIFIRYIMEQPKWNMVFNVGKGNLLNKLSEHNIDTKLVSQHGKPLFDSLYGLRDYLISDAKTSDKISNRTKQYINKQILSSLNSSIDSYWGSVGYLKKQTFKLLKKSKEKQIKNSMGTLVLVFVLGLNDGLNKIGNKDTNLGGVVYDLENHMGFNTSFSIAALSKINSLSA